MPTLQLDKAYSPAHIEDAHYERWESAGYFKAPIREGRKPYVIMMPPPNVTGVLTMGHVLNNSIQDMLIRWHRMCGEDTLWLPGMDHAGLATQVKVEQDLAKEKLSRHDLGREKMLERIWQWKDKHGGIILKQLRKLGASCDWSRERFTLDDGFVHAVLTIFKHLYDKGLIYRGKRIVNWDPVLQTALSDEQVEYKNVTSNLWHFRYPLEDGSGYLVVATTRPETMLGDTAVAVHPQDERYRHLHGKSIVLPLVGRKIPIVADEYVDKEFGTGCVKVTPSHDPNDFEIGQRHKLEFVNVIGADGLMTAAVPAPYRGLKREEARKKVIADLEALELLEKIEPYAHSVAHSERTGAVIEPLLSEQWFVSMKSLAEPALQSVREGRVQFHPQHWEKTFFHWMENVRDWCISRQVWWGHRIPLWTIQETGEIICSVADPRSDPKYSGKSLVQDPDVLDTWFSSWLWSFATLGWPDKTRDLDHFHPTNLIVTGPDIIFLWIARMMIAAEEVFHVQPFSDVYFTGMVRDMKGRKMSKSLGNSPDPLDVIAQFGADAMRFTMISQTPHGGDVRFGPDMCEYGRNFANKIWNATRFLGMNLPEAGDNFEFPRLETVQNPPDNLIDRWISSAFYSTLQDVTTAWSEWKFAEAAKRIYGFLWNDFCDWYLELTKTRLQSNDPVQKNAALAHAFSILEAALRMLHPMMPFITEELYLKLKQLAPGALTDDSIMLATFPAQRPAWINADVEAEFTLLQNVVGALRNIRGELNIQKNVDMQAGWITAAPAQNRFLEEFSPFIVRLGGLAKLECTDHRPTGSASAVASGVEIYVKLGGLIDPAAEKNRLNKEYERLTKLRGGTEAKLANEQFVSSAKPEVVEAERSKLSDLNHALEKVALFLKEVEALGGQ